MCDSWGKENISKKWLHHFNKIAQTKTRKATEPKKIILSVKMKLLKFSLPLNSAKNLLPALPKKLEINIVIIKQKFNVMLNFPRVAAPNVLPTRKLKVEGISPIKINAKPVYIELFTRRFLKKEWKELKLFFIKVYSKGNCKNQSRKKG